MSDSLWPHGLQHTRPPCASPAPRVYLNSCPLSRWCHPTISSAVVPFSSRLQSFPASGSAFNNLFENNEPLSNDHKTKSLTKSQIKIKQRHDSDQISHSVVSYSLWPHESQHARPPCPSPSPGVHWDSCPSSQWCHPTISSSGIPFSSCPQSLPASESFPMSQLFAWGSQSIVVPALASFLPKKSQGWSPSEWTGWMSLQSKGLSRVFSNTTVQKHQFFSTQSSSQSNSHIHTWAGTLGVPLEGTRHFREL